MRLVHCSVALSFAFLAVAASAQQPPPAAGEAIGHPPPLPGPPPLSEPGESQSPQPTPDKAKPAADQPKRKTILGPTRPRARRRPRFRRVPCRKRTQDRVWTWQGLTERRVRRKPCRAGWPPTRRTASRPAWEFPNSMRGRGGGVRRRWTSGKGALGDTTIEGVVCSVDLRNRQICINGSRRPA